MLNTIFCQGAERQDQLRLKVKEIPAVLGPKPWFKEVSLQVIMGPHGDAYVIVGGQQLTTAKYYEVRDSPCCAHEDLAWEGFCAQLHMIFFPGRSEIVSWCPESKLVVFQHKFVQMYAVIWN